MVKSFQSTEELEQFLLNHGENIVDLMGGEIDRIEMKLRVSEILHIARTFFTFKHFLSFFCYLEKIP